MFEALKAALAKAAAFLKDPLHNLADPEQARAEAHSEAYLELSAAFANVEAQFEDLHARLNKIEQMAGVREEGDSSHHMSTTAQTAADPAEGHGQSA